jgi:hypothetical protein
MKHLPLIGSSPFAQSASLGDAFLATEDGIVVLSSPLDGQTPRRKCAGVFA